MKYKFKKGDLLQTNEGHNIIQIVSICERYNSHMYCILYLVGWWSPLTIDYYEKRRIETRYTLISGSRP